MIQDAAIGSFSREIEKIAKASSSIKEVQEELESGDILQSSHSGTNLGLPEKMLRRVNRWYQGTPFSHSALYVGDGSIIHAGRSPGTLKAGVREEPLRSYAKRYNFRALRVKTDKDKREEAVEYARKQLGKKFNLKGIFRIAFPFKGESASARRDRKDAAEAFFCSELIANAYHDTNMAKRKKLQHIMPIDFRKSPLTKEVAEFKKEAKLPGQFKRVMKPVKFKRTHRPERLKRFHKPVKAKGYGSGMSKTAQVDAHQQEKEWSCSAATLTAAAKHHGKDISEEEAIKAIGTRKGRGAETTDIVEGAKKLGFDAYEKSFESLDAAKKVLKQGLPIIADVQSFNYPGKGHYVLLAGYYPGKGFLLMDPNTKGKTAVPNWRILSDKQMNDRWWDRAMEPPHNLMIRWGVVVSPGIEKRAVLVGEDPLGWKALRRAKAENARHSGLVLEGCADKKKVGQAQMGAFFDELDKIAELEEIKQNHFSSGAKKGVVLAALGMLIAAALKRKGSPSHPILGDLSRRLARGARAAIK